MRKLKICRKCGRYLKGKRWLEPPPGEVERARRMERLELSLCGDCQRSPTTHNAVLQVRGFPGEELDALVEEEVRRHGGAAFFKGGAYHFRFKKTARAVARRLRELGAQLKESSKIVTYDNLRSRQLTRLTISARFPFAPGDVVEYRGERYLVSKVRGKFVFARSGRKFPVRDAKKVEASRRKGFYISKNPPLVFIEESGETVEVPESGEGGVEVVESGGKRWVVK